MAAATPPTIDQLWFLLHQIQHDSEMYGSMYLAPDGQVRVMLKWNSLSLQLNQMGGAVRTGAGWRQVYQQLKMRAKRMDTAIINAQLEGWPAPAQLDPLHAMVLEMLHE